VRAVRYHDAARLELLHEVGYYSAIHPGLGERFDCAVQAAVRHAAEFAELGAPYFFGTRRVFPGKFKFSIVYLVTADEIWIVAIAPFSRRPGYWNARKSAG
jgi:hypothetical protein